MINWWVHSKNMKLIEILWWLFNGRARTGKQGAAVWGQIGCPILQAAQNRGISKSCIFLKPLHLAKSLFWVIDSFFQYEYQKIGFLFNCMHAFLTKGRWLKINSLDMKTFMLFLDTKNCAYRSRGLWCLINFCSSILS
jgi:hypothetical protein